MQQLISKDYRNQTLPSHFDVYNVSNEPIDALKVAKILQLPAGLLLKFNEKSITKEELEEQYFRGLDSLGQHLIATTYGSGSVIVCNCKSYRHSGACPIPYLKKYLKKKNVEIEKY